MKGYRKAIVCIIVLGMMMIPFGNTSSAEEITLEGGIQTVHLNLKTKPNFSPETEATQEAIEEKPPKSYTSELLDLGRTREWKTIGTWEANGVQYDTTYEGSAKFNIWWVQDPNDNEYTADVQYRWTLMVDGQEMAYYEDETEHNCEQARGNPCEWTGSTGFNTTEPLVAGQVLSVEIEYWAFADIYIYYDNSTFDSGVSFDADAVYFGAGAYNSNDVSFDVVEAWATNLDKAVDGYFVYMIVNSVTQANDEVTIGSGAEYDVGNSKATGQKITWPIGVDSAPSVTFSYTSNESSAPSTLINLKAGASGGGGLDGDEGGGLGIPGFSTAMVIVSIGLMAGVKRRV